ncbi:invasion associated locus B family protein [Pararhizobium haloflavum]|uniref:invasion associated locus B family protein n=1 Tax=Pararhizobium haloflavum TaxID=2037914 RepID=UPI000C175DF1|nr:invasion associated locus B family protein [Pararhizobium haloflavum]
MLPSLTKTTRDSFLAAALLGASVVFAPLPALAQEDAAPQEEGQAEDNGGAQPEAPAGTQTPTEASPDAPVQPQAEQPGAVRSNHGAWSIVCDQEAGAPNEQCALMQNVIAEDRPEVGLSVVVLKTADDQGRILRVLAPLGVLLPNGLGLNVDGEDIGRAYFVRCFTDGCYAEVILEDELLQTMREGTTATFIVFQTPEEGIGIPVDLDGFGEGFDALP